MTDSTTRLGFDDVAAAGLADWVHIRRTLKATYRPADFAAGLAFVNRIGEAAEAANHHPDITLKWGLVAVTTSSHDVGGLTSRDLDLARAITQVAADLGIRADPLSVSEFTVALDTRDAPGTIAFWQAITGWKASDDAVQHRDQLLPELWFQDTDSDAPDRQRFHLDIEVARDQVEPRMAAAIAAGGTLVDDSHAPRFWVLADTEGNKVCLCTCEGRTP
ncbi:4a-hydroxytetrahydrobiopterin dehydratase [Propionibacteriaceae bacterium G1746]|uniref:4a-hydroxytetrahydrobiopterin dehydratase n=1 Tax=Aestuariimicrobium sp. G57 TaxID=3418485 RepID=UPI003C19646E